MKNNTNSKPNRIPITFKNTPKELELYLWLSKKSCRAGFIKDILYKVMNEEKNMNK